MAVINEQTILRAKYTLYYRVNQHKVPIQLPFVMVTIDEDDQFWQPISNLTHDDYECLWAQATSVVYLDRNQSLPVGAEFPTFEYYGV